MKAKDKIKEAAKKLFLEKGYSKTTTREIAEEAGENLGLIAYYYKTKDRLANIIYDEMVDEIFIDMKVEKITYDNLIEKLFLSNIMAEKKLLGNKRYYRFLMEVLEKDIVGNDYTKYTFLLCQKIIEEYSLDVLEEDLHKYLTIGKSAERILIQKKIKGLLNISYIEINKLVILTSLMLLGIGKEMIEESIDNCIARLDQDLIAALQ